MWHSIEKQLGEVLNTAVEFKDKKIVSGGDINDCFAVVATLENHRADRHYFIKVNQRSKSDMFHQEAFSLAHLAQHPALRIPTVVCHGETKENAFLVLEHIEFSRPSETDWRMLGKGLAQLHQQTEQAMFGWDEDNFIGTTRQPNAWHAHWDTFFAEERIGWQLQLAAEKQLFFGEIDLLVDSAKTMLHRHRPYPALVHGDLWKGNIAFANDKPVVFDPACYFGDREVDLAMTELFGALPGSFYQGYREVLPIAEDYSQRKALYNLYHLLNHANLFGGHYVEQARRVIQQILL